MDVLHSPFALEFRVHSRSVDESPKEGKTEVKDLDGSNAWLLA
jgi:hypothetical protein